MLTIQAFADFRAFVTKRAGRMQYHVGSTWYDAPIVETVITGDGTARIKGQIAHGAACTIVEVRLLNTENDVWATKTVNVEIERAGTNLMQMFDFNFSESEVS